jgi:ankyrin repeat protein
MVARLLEGGADPNLAQLSGETPLMTCSGTGNGETVKALIARGARVNQRGGRNGQTALMWAAARQHDEVLRILIAHGAGPGIASSTGFTPLLFAAQQGDLSAAELLLASGASIREAAPDYGNALVLASASGHEVFAIAMLDKGADPDSADSSGMTAMHYALLRGLSRLVGLRVELIQQGYMFRPDMPKLVKALLDRHANPNVRITKLSQALPTGNGWSIDPAGATPFLLATASLDLNVMRMLVQGGANPLIATKENATPLMLAAGIGLTKDRSETEESAALDAAKMLVKLGADVNAVDSTGQTPLHGAAYIGADAVIQFLVEQGARIDVKDSYGMTPLSIAQGIVPPDLKDVDKNPKIAHKSTVALLRKLQTAESLGQN